MTYRKRALIPGALILFVFVINTYAHAETTQNLLYIYSGGKKIGYSYDSVKTEGGVTDAVERVRLKIKLLDNTMTDFGKHIIPDSIEHRRVFAYIFQGYWEDVGTIRSFFDANLAMCSLKPAFGFFDRSAPVYTRARFLPPSKVLDSHISESIIADGCFIMKSRIQNCIVGLRSYIGDGCELKNTIIMGCDYYAAAPDPTDDQTLTMPHLAIGRGCKIDRAIIDKNVQIGEGVVITNKEGAPDCDAPTHYVRDGIVIIPKNSVIRAGTRI